LDELSLAARNLYNLERTLRAAEGIEETLDLDPIHLDRLRDAVLEGLAKPGTSSLAHDPRVCDFLDAVVACLHSFEDGA